LAQGLIQPGSGPNRLPTSVIPSPATCSVECLKGRRVSVDVATIAELAPHLPAPCQRASQRLCALLNGRQSLLSFLTRLPTPSAPQRLSPLSCSSGHHGQGVELHGRPATITLPPQPTLSSSSWPRVAPLRRLLGHAVTCRQLPLPATRAWRGSVAAPLLAAAGQGQGQARPRRSTAKPLHASLWPPTPLQPAKIGHRPATGLLCSPPRQGPRATIRRKSRA